MENFNGNNYVLVDNHWFAFYEGTLTKTENNIYVKSYSITQENIVSIEKQFNVTFKKRFLTHFYIFKIDSNHNLIKKARSIDSIPYTVYAELGVFGKYHSNPNDQYYPIGLGTGQQFLYSTGVGIGADSAWTITTGDSNIVVAVLDKGINYYHPDLGMGVDGYENIYKNKGEDPWTGILDPITGNRAGNGIDDDGNGFIDDWKGWNFYSSPASGGIKDANWHAGSVVPNTHGTPVSGIIAAKTHNNTGVAGIAGGWNGKGVQILTINIGPAFGYEILNDAVLYAVKMKSDIINMSFDLGFFHNKTFDSTLQYAYDRGVTIIASSGNDALRPWYYMSPKVYYPASSKYVLGVGAYNYLGSREPYSHYGEFLSISAPSITKTLNASGYGNFNYTSAAAPQVAGVIALMKSINNCISTGDIYEMIKATATKSGGYNYNWNNSKPGHSKELGYGRINAFKAVKLAQSYNSSTLDLYMKDDKEDFGLEPNNNSTRFYLSPDIWIRNANDGLSNWEHQNPEYDPTVPVYVNIRIRNKSCQNSFGNEKLFLHWTKAGTNLPWPTSWDGSTSSPVLGDLVDSISIPVINAGRDIILTIPWIIPNPNQYTSVGNNMWHFCLLARIKSNTDTMFISESVPGNFIKSNNNIILKNVTVIDSMTSGGGGGGSIRKYSGTISVSNQTSISEEYNLSFYSDGAGENSINNYYDIILEIDGTLNQKIINSQNNNGIEFLEDNKILITENNFVLKNLDFKPNEFLTLNLTFLLKSDVEITQNEFHFHVNQIHSHDSTTIGGEMFVIKPTNEDLTINADAGDDVTTTSNETITIEADYVSEDAIYKWYDDEGNLIAEGQEFDINNEISETYQLVVFDITNGLTDEDYINIIVDDNQIELISPNPTSSQMEVNFNVDNCTNSYLMIIENGIVHNYITTNLHSKTIQTNGFSTGTHTILLICDGVIKDIKNFVKI